MCSLLLLGLALGAASQDYYCENEVPPLRYSNCKWLADGYSAFTFVVTRNSTLGNVTLESQRVLRKSGISRNAPLIAKFNHDHIVRYLESYVWKNNLFLELEYVQGKSFGKIVKHGELPDPVVLTDWLVQLADALVYLHHHNNPPVYHNDMHDNNVLVTQQGKIKVIDFDKSVHGDNRNFSKENDGHEPHSATESPERAAGLLYDGKDDTWAVGVLLSELLTGVNIRSRCPKNCHAFQSHPDLVAQVVEESLSVAPPCMAGLIQGLLQLDPALRLDSRQLRSRSLELQRTYWSGQCPRNRLQHPSENRRHPSACRRFAKLEYALWAIVSFVLGVLTSAIFARSHFCSTTSPLRVGH
eukprot:gb/GEZN01010681.1/.p1 GENE.gb/GEZN01010681.1/~~gb/GEZN01010681.1/.p1  ORF type:complete len:356 (+),score=35.28 gb/GEZN01010681.1/:116-1183(+)